MKKSRDKITKKKLSHNIIYFDKLTVRKKRKKLFKWGTFVSIVKKTLFVRNRLCAQKALGKLFNYFMEEYELFGHDKEKLRPYIINKICV